MIRCLSTGPWGGNTCIFIRLEKDPTSEKTSQNVRKPVTLMRGEKLCFFVDLIRYTVSSAVASRHEQDSSFSQ